MSPPIVGLVANPASSKDIRRLVGLARVVDVEEKANMVARFLAGLWAGPPTVVVAFDDAAGLVRRAVHLTRSTQTPPVEFLPLRPEGREADTRRAAALLAEAGAGVLVTVGGDGTVRSAVEGWPDATLLPLAAGTNNAIVEPSEPTVAGYVAALVAAGRASVDRTLTVLKVSGGPDGPAVAVVDAVGVRTRWTGARALWQPESFVEAVVANVRTTAVGMASVAAAFGPIPAGHARHIVFGPGTQVRAILGPGLVTDVDVASTRLIRRGEAVSFSSETRVVALDGERRVVTPTSKVEVDRGPRLVQVAEVLERTRKPASAEAATAWTEE